MKISNRLCFPVVLIATMLLAGCSYSRIVTSWSDGDFQRGQIKKPMVVAIVQQNITRWRLEDEFVNNLRKMGVDAVQSYKTLPDLKGLTVDAVKAHLAETGSDGVLVTRLIDTKVETGYVDATTTSTAQFSSYYIGSSTTTYSPGYTYDYRVFKLESKLFAAKNEKLVWTAVTEAEEPPDSIDNALKEFSRIVTDDLKNKKVF